jgi:ribosome-associated protein
MSAPVLPSRMPDPIVVASGVRVPAAAIRMSAARASGPGGQNVNKVASKVELRVDPLAIEGLGEAARQRLLSLVRRRLDADGWILVTSQRTRDQPRNLEDAREKVRDLVAAALVEPRRRRKTKPSRASKDRRIAAKKRRGEQKQLRGRGGDD